MGVRVAEYLGLRTDIDMPLIIPAQLGARCPFMDSVCPKAKTGQQPFCSVRKPDGTLWISCKHRLCSTSKKLALNPHQVQMLHSIAQVVFDPSVTLDDVCVKREEPLPVDKDTRYSADYIMTLRNGKSPFPGPDRIVLEMQGGGETSNTKQITNLVAAWADNPMRTNTDLRADVQKVGTIETNAWRRQQEQFIVKGNIAMKTWKGYGIAFCVGAPLYDYLLRKVIQSRMPDLRENNWTLALIGISEDAAAPPISGPIPLVADPQRMLFTNYQTFVQALINQGEPSTKAFSGVFVTLSRKPVLIPKDGR